MRDDFLSADWAAHHSSLSKALARLARRTFYAFQRLNAYEYDAPWHRTPAPRRPIGCG